MYGEQVERPRALLASPAPALHVLSSLGPLKPVPWGLLWGRHHVGMVDYPLHCELLSLETERWG